jgi:hypothetical protein
VVFFLNMEFFNGMDPIFSNPDRRYHGGGGSGRGGLGHRGGAVVASRF